MDFSFIHSDTLGLLLIQNTLQIFDIFDPTCLDLYASLRTIFIKIQFSTVISNRNPTQLTAAFRVIICKTRQTFKLLMGR